VATAALSARQSFLDNISDPRWTGGLKLDEHGGSVPRLVQACGAGTWSPFHRDLSEATLAEAHALGLKVIPWTVNEPALMDQLIGWGVDGLISDYPDRLRAAMQRAGLPLPTP
jgi:glycerophosphoryl diester phosphodiesterase